MTRTMLKKITLGCMYSFSVVRG